MLGVSDVARLRLLDDFTLVSDATADTNDAGDMVLPSSSSPASDIDERAAEAIASGCW